MIDADFGSSQDTDKIVNDVLKEKITTNAIETHQLLIESYDSQYGICNHDTRLSNPMSLVELHEKERLDKTSPLYEMMSKYAEKKVLKHFGLSYIEFIGQPRDWVTEMFRICDVLNKQDASDNQAALDELENLKKGIDDRRK